jgi:hypothetical protein
MRIVMSDASPSAAAAPRFRWPMRLLLFALLFHMFFRSTDILYPWDTWRSDFKMKRMPRALPTRAQLAELRAAAGGSWQPVWAEFEECGVSALAFLNPLPGDETRQELTSSLDELKYCLAWTATRLQWFERLLAIDQEWAMFSPNVSKRKYPARARLFFADGSETTHRMRCDPEDLTCYSRWDQGKNLGIDPRVAADSGMRRWACPGYCNYLLHRHPTNAHGSPLVEIRFYQVTYDFAPPGVDPTAFYRDVMEKTRDHDSPQAWPTYYIYDARKREGRFVEAAR